MGGLVAVLLSMLEKQELPPAKKGRKRSRTYRAPSRNPHENKGIIGRRVSYMIAVQAQNRAVGGHYAVLLRALGLPLDRSLRTMALDQ